jgi:hypothetical protein
MDQWALQRPICDMATLPPDGWKFWSMVTIMKLPKRLPCEIVIIAGLLLR